VRARVHRAGDASTGASRAQERLAAVIDQWIAAASAVAMPQTAKGSAVLLQTAEPARMIARI